MAKGKNKGTFHVLGPPPEEEARRNLLLEVFCSFLGPEEAAQQLDLLLNRFGSFKSILTAPEEELVLAGASEQTARFLRQSTELARAYLEEDAKSLKRIFDTKSACEVMRPKFLGRENELMAVLLLNGRGQILYCDVLAEGSVSSVPIYKRSLVELCIRYNVQTVFIAHNHPSGLACPSRNDIVATRHIQLSLKGIDAWLSDHIIFAGDDYCSFRSMGLLELIGQSLDEEWLREIEAARQLEQSLLYAEGNGKEKPRK